MSSDMDGFLPFSRASFMLDFAATALIPVLVIFTYSLYIVKYQRKYALHKRLQLSLAAVLLVVLVLFELDVRLNGWTQYAEASPHYSTYVFPALIVHLMCAIATVLLWTFTIYGALKNYSATPVPGAYSATHKKLGKLSAIGMYLTLITAWVFFYVAFVAQ